MATGPSGASGLFISGDRESGQDVRISNVTAAISISNIIKSSLGPIGLDKMLVDEIGDVIITNDGASILRQLEVEHPAARVLVDIAQLQDKEVGDGTTSVVLIAAELLRRGNELVKQGIHPTTILNGFKLALKASIAYIKKELLLSVNSLDDEHLMNAAKTSMSSKIIGAESDFFARLTVDAVRSVKTEVLDDKKQRWRYPISGIHIMKIHGKSTVDSQLIPNGFAIRDTKASQAMPTSIPGPSVKIAMLDMNLQRHRMGLGVQITITDPKEIDKMRQREMDITKERIHKIINTGAKVILTTKGMDDLCMKYLVEAGVIGVRRVDRQILARLAKATNGRIVTTMVDMEGNEVFDEGSLGTCESVGEKRVGDGENLYFYGCSGTSASTIILRGPNEYMLDEVDRALHDSLCVVKRILETNTLVPGGGAVEAALNVYLQQTYATSLDTREQLAVMEFADALLVIPKTLGVNAAKDSSELVAQLRSKHALDAKHNKNFGLDLANGEVIDNMFQGVVEPAISKIKSLRFATEAANTILRIDDRITVEDKKNSSGGPMGR